MTTKESLNAPTRPGNQGSTRARYVTSQRTISSSLLSWTNWTEGQGDDQGPRVRRSERSEGLGSLLVIKRSLLVIEGVHIYPTPRVHSYRTLHGWRGETHPTPLALQKSGVLQLRHGTQRPDLGTHRRPHEPQPCADRPYLRRHLPLLPRQRLLSERDLRPPVARSHRSDRKHLRRRSRLLRHYERYRQARQPRPVNRRPRPDRTRKGRDT